jgi:hypothetical protein
VEQATGELNITSNRNEREISAEKRHAIKLTRPQIPKPNILLKGHP